jgi:hypothetical protein
LERETASQRERESRREREIERVREGEREREKHSGNRREGRTGCLGLKPLSSPLRGC